MPSSLWTITTVVLTGCLAISGALAWYFADQLGKAKDDELRRYQTESKVSIARANERAAKLENEAAQAHLELERLTSPRFEKFNREAFHDKIRGKPKIRVELLLQKDDVDSYMLAMAIKGCLNAENWSTIAPRPIREEDVSGSQIDKDAPMSARAGVNLGGIALKVKNVEPGLDMNNPVNVLIGAFTAAKGAPGVPSSTVFGTDSRSYEWPGSSLRIGSGYCKEIVLQQCQNGFRARDRV